MEEIFTFIDNLSKRLARPIKDLDDVRGSMSALSEIREAEIRYMGEICIETCLWMLQWSFCLLVFEHLELIQHVLRVE